MEQVCLYTYYIKVSCMFTPGISLAVCTTAGTGSMVDEWKPVYIAT